MATLVRTIAGRSVRLNFADGLEPHAESVLSMLEAERAGGMALRPGLRIRYGWTFLILQEKEGELVVCEPDYMRNPFTQTRDDLSVFLRVTASQTTLAKTLGVEPVEVSFQDKIVYANGVFESGRLYAERIQPRPQQRDSGWFFGFIDGDNSQPNLRAGHVFELLMRKPILMQTLVLPTGSMVILDGDQIQDILGQGNTSLLRR